jgi:hypothetical protein
MPGAGRLLPWSWASLVVGQRMNVSALSPDHVGWSGVGGGKRLPDAERGGSGDAIGKADRGMLAVVGRARILPASIAISGGTGTRAIPA